MHTAMEMISVVIPLYNKRLHIARAVESVLSQTMQNLEVIVVDDGSTDGGGDVVKEINSPKIRLFRQRNYGVSGARNLGISEAKGELIAFLDADDEWKPGFLEKIVYLREKYTRAGAYATGVVAIIDDGSLEVRNPHILENNLEDGLILNYFKIASQFPLTSSSIVIPKKILVEVGGFHLFEELSEDVDTWIRVALRYPIAWSKEHLVILHKEAENRAVITKRYYSEPVISRTIRHAIRAGIVPQESLQDATEFSVIFQIIAARSNLMEGRRRDALLLLDYAKGTKRFSQEWWILRIFSLLPLSIGTKLWKILYLEGKMGIKKVFKKLLN